MSIYFYKLINTGNGLKNIQNDWLKKWNRYRFQAILLVCFFVWTPLLITETLQIQHSCHPMISFTKKLPQEYTKSSCNPSNPFPEPSNSNKSTNSSNVNQANLDAITIGVALGATAAIAGVPIMIAAGLGIIAWLAVRKLF